MYMEKKTVIVTGGSKGIGKSITKILLKDGYHVVVCARTETDLEKLKTEYSEIGSLETIQLDLSDKNAIKSFCSSWKKSLYGLINSAGICGNELLEEKKEGVWDSILNTNLHGPYFLTKGLLSHITDNGRIVNIASQLGKEGRAGYSAYCASKFGLIGLTKTWAYELGPRGITVNAICPGWVRTDMAETDLSRMAKEMGISRDEWYNQICTQLEMKRFTEPGEVADLVGFLTSEKGSGITGRDWLLNVIWNQD